MYEIRTTFAATTAVMAEKVELPFHKYFSDTKYIEIGTRARERLKMMSLSSTPPPSWAACAEVSAETPRALIVLEVECGTRVG